MVEVYKYIPEIAKGKLVLKNDGYFAGNIIPKEFDSRDIEIISNIDKATIVDFKSLAIKTPFGITSLLNLSTGCKTVLNYRHINRHRLDLYIDATECGVNALEELFNEVERVTKPVLIRHSNHLFECSTRLYRIHYKHGEVVESTDPIELMS